MFTAVKKARKFTQDHPTLTRLGIGVAVGLAVGHRVYKPGTPANIICMMEKENVAALLEDPNNYLCLEPDGKLLNHVHLGIRGFTLQDPAMNFSQGR